MKKLICIVTVCFMIIAMFSGCGVLQKLGLMKNDDELRPASSIVMNEDEAKKLTDKVPIHLYFASEDNTKLKLEVRYIPMAEAKKSVNNLASIIVKELIKGPTANNGLKPTIPAGTQLRAPININAGVASVDFTKEFVDKHPGGKEAEQLTIYSVVNSLTELKEIQKVKFTINGKVQKDFKGSYQFDVPFPRSASLISKAANLPGSVITKPGDDKKKETDKKDTEKKDTDKTKPNTSPQPDTKKDTNKKDTTKDNKDGKAIDTNANQTDDVSTQGSLDPEELSEETYLETLE